MYFLSAVLFLICFGGLIGLLLEEVGKIERVVEAQLVGDLFDRHFLILKETFGLRCHQSIDHILSRLSRMQFG